MEDRHEVSENIHVMSVSIGLHVDTKRYNADKMSQYIRDRMTCKITQTKMSTVIVDGVTQGPKEFLTVDINLVNGRKVEHCENVIENAFYNARI